MINDSDIKISVSGPNDLTRRLVLDAIADSLHGLVNQVDKGDRVLRTGEAMNTRKLTDEELQAIGKAAVKLFDIPGKVEFRNLTIPPWKLAATLAAVAATFGAVAYLFWGTAQTLGM